MIILIVPASRRIQSQERDSREAASDWMSACAAAHSLEKGGGGGEVLAVRLDGEVEGGGYEHVDECDGLR